MQQKSWLCNKVVVWRWLCRCNQRQSPGPHIYWIKMQHPKGLSAPRKQVEAVSGWVKDKKAGNECFSQRFFLVICYLNANTLVCPGSWHHQLMLFSLLYWQEESAGFALRLLANGSGEQLLTHPILGQPGLASPLPAPPPPAKPQTTRAETHQLSHPCGCCKP